ncbi:hypothetical protein CDL60_23930 [Roseateles noduli]|nr:hypothetical protein CDL60_23930 [Roseateles noduli]
MTSAVGDLLAKALMQRGVGAESACLQVEAWCVERFEAAFRAGSPGERRQWCRNVAVGATGSFALARRRSIEALPATGYQAGTIRDGMAGTVAAAYVMRALERAGLRSRRP